MKCFLSVNVTVIVTSRRAYLCKNYNLSLQSDKQITTLSCILFQFNYLNTDHSHKTEKQGTKTHHLSTAPFNPYPTAFPYGNGMVLHFYQQQESSTTKTVHKVINKGLKTYV